MERRGEFWRLKCLEQSFPDIFYFNFFFHFFFHLIFISSKHKNCKGGGEISRLKLLHNELVSSTYRLETYLLLHPDLTAAATTTTDAAPASSTAGIKWGNGSRWRAFHRASLFSLMAYAAKSGEISALRLLWSRHVTSSTTSL